jgi:hypothetical protein
LPRERKPFVHKAGSGSAEWCVISRREIRMQAKADVDTYRQGNVFPRQYFIPLSHNRCEQRSLDEALDIAVFEALKRIQVAVRRVGKSMQADYGADLMRRTFHTRMGPLTDVARVESERQALSDLIAGAIGCFKNRHSYRTSPSAIPTEAAE